MMYAVLGSCRIMDISPKKDPEVISAIFCILPETGKNTLDTPTTFLAATYHNSKPAWYIDAGFRSATKGVR